MGKNTPDVPPAYTSMLDELFELLDTARRAAARSVNAVMTATYWEIGRRVVEFEQRGMRRAEYGSALLKRLSADLRSRFGRGFSISNLKHMRQFYLSRPDIAVSTDLHTDCEIGQTASGLFPAAAAFPLPWSHYVELLSVKSPEARAFYEREALAGGWTIRQLRRQVGSQFFERAALSRNKAAMLEKGQRARPGDRVTPEEEIRDPLVLEFLDLKDEYSESELEEALIRCLEEVLLELGGDFAFVGRQRRLRVGDSWFRVDLVFFHRRLRALVVIDLKLTRFTPADVGQMNLYLNYARRHWTHEDENPPVGLVVCAGKDRAVAEYAMEGIENKMLARDYLTSLPAPEALAAKLEEARKRFEARGLPASSGE